MAQQTIEYKVKVDTGNSVKTLGQLEEELAGINEELKDVEVGSDRFKELSKSAQQATKSIEDINSEIAGITGEDKIRGLDGAVKVLGGSVQGLVGGLGLLGVESETFGKFEEAAASAIAFGIGIKDVSEGIGQLGPLFKKSGIAAKLFGITTKQALIATGIGIFAVALGSIIAYWDDIVKGIEKFGQKVPFVGKAIQALKDGFNSVVEFFRPVLEFLGIMPTEAERANNAVIASNEALIESGNRELALLQARGAKAEEIFKQREKMLKAELDNLRRTDAEKEEIYQKETELLALQAAEEKRIQDERAAAAKKRADERKAEQKKKEEEAKAQREKEEQEEKDRLQSLEDIRKSYEERRRDDAAVTEEQKILLEQTRALEELDRLNANEQQKLDVINYYNDLIEQARKTDAENAKNIAEQTAQEIIDAKIAEKEGVVAIEMAKFDLLAQGADLLSELAGESKGAQIAAVVAQQAAAIGQIVSATGLANAKAVAAFPLTLGQPWVGINTASAGLSIAAAINSARKSISEINSAGDGGGGIGGGAPRLPMGRSAGVPSTPTAQTPTLSEINDAQSIAKNGEPQQPVRAYVLQGDITSGNEAASKLRQRRVVGKN